LLKEKVLSERLGRAERELITGKYD
jgi:hypothetical protein